ncbi:demethoxyubiquinone hydroxylase family protein, partial [Candidatus Pelagibacter sp.]|nr:demethoxyubiquinone hydroxylase family protein [Candidatus Pelagibacter sp.]
ILMANAASVFRSLAKMNSSLSKTAMYINNQVKDSSYQSMFITAVIGKINIEKKEMEYVNIGHEPMMVLDASFDFKYLDATLPPLGMMMVKNEDHFKTTTMDIADKTILIYTDGLTEGYINNKEELTVTGFENEIKKRNIKPTKFLPLWDLLGVGLGFGSTMLGKKAAMLCTASVEEVIDEHYLNQINELENDEKKLKEKIIKFRKDELHHKDIAYKEGATKKGMYSILDKLIKTGSKIAINISEKI